MYLIIHILLALVFVAGLLCFVQEGKKYALTYNISASVQLVLLGLSSVSNVYFVCMVWSLVLLILEIAVLMKKNISIISIILLQMPMIAFWFMIELC